MTSNYLEAVRAGLMSLKPADRERALEALAAQLAELGEANLDPAVALGDAGDYAAQLSAALTDPPQPADPQWRVLGLPVETRGPGSAEVRTRAWDPLNPRIIVPRIFGLGWRLNYGALAVRLGLLRPDDASPEVFEAISEVELRVAQAVPAVIAGITSITLAASWRKLPRKAPKATLILQAALGAIPAAWAQLPQEHPEDRLIRAALSSSMAVLSVAAVATTVAQAQTKNPQQDRWELLPLAAVPVAGAATLATLVVPIRRALSRIWSKHV
ncbi:MAG: hypothetical protein FWD83_03460 [Promicromonosporaceae bacterium]|nr:hypothetical protein [Promicromonosporaceae bacterium]